MNGGRGLRIVAITVVVSLIVLAVLDRVAAHVVAGQIASRAQRTENLPSRPDVSLGGFPFLTQVVAGRYRDVEVDVRGYTQQGARVDRVHARLSGVRLPLSNVVRGQVKRIPVDRVTAEVDLTFDDINAYLAAQGSSTRVTAAGSAIRISGNVSILGMNYPLTGTADLGVEPTSVTFTPRELAQTVGSLLPPPLRATAVSLLTAKIPVNGLPFNMTLRSATVSPDRLTFAAAGENVVLDTTATGSATSSG
jgi:LmeA-like phospholipid-binding